MNASSQPVRQGHLLVYTIGRTYLLELLRTQLQNEVVRFVDGRLMRRAYEQLVNLETEYRESGMVYVCPPGHHDDLGGSCAMLVRAARHPHMPYWFRNLEASRAAPAAKNVRLGSVYVTIEVRCARTPDNISAGKSAPQ